MSKVSEQTILLLLVMRFNGFLYLIWHYDSNSACIIALEALKMGGCFHLTYKHPKCHCHWFPILQFSICITVDFSYCISQN
jgi:hypothetical protein